MSWGTEGADGRIAQQKARSHPNGAKEKGRAWEAFPWGKTVPRLGNFSSCFLCLSLVPPVHGRDSSKAEGFVFLLARPNERGVSGLAVGRVHSHHGKGMCTARLGNRGQKQKGNPVFPPK